MRAQVDALQPLAEHAGRESAHPLVEIAEHDLRLPDAAVVHDGAEPSRLVPALEKRRAQVDVVEVQRVVAERDVDALAAARLARLPREVVLRVMADRVAAEDDVAEQRAAQMPGRRHHPPHPQQRTELLGVALRARPGANDFLQRDDVGLDCADHLRNPRRIGAPVEPAAAMDVVGGDAQRAPVGVGHECYDAIDGWTNVTQLANSRSDSDP